MLKGTCFSSALFALFAEGGTCLPDTWAAGVAPSLDTPALELSLVTKESHTFRSLRIGREQHVADFPNLRCTW